MNRIVPALILASMLALPAAMAADPHAHTAPGVAATSNLLLDNGRKWATDAPLRRGISAIRSVVAHAPQAAHGGTAKPAVYADLGRRVEAQVGRIVAECKLEPRADAMLHLVVADLVAGADAMKAAKTGAEGQAGLERVAVALNAYGDYFDDKGFRPVK